MCKGIFFSLSKKLPASTLALFSGLAAKASAMMNLLFPIETSLARNVD